MRAAHTLAYPTVHQLARMEIPAYQGCKNKYSYLARVHKGPTMVHVYSCHLEQATTNNTRHKSYQKVSTQYAFDWSRIGANQKVVEFI